MSGTCATDSEVDDMLARVADLLRHSPDAQIVLARDRVIRGWNGAAERLLGYCAAEAIGRRAEILFPAPDPRGGDAARLDRALDGGEVPPYEASFLRQGGEAVAVSVCLSALSTSSAASAQPAGVLLTLRDNRERQAADALALDREFRLSAIVDHSPSALSLKTVDGRYVLANPNLQRIHHLSEAEIIGKTDFDLYPAEIAPRWPGQTAPPLASQTAPGRTCGL
jgi:PAS domain S-box-containing protein